MITVPTIIWIIVYAAAVCASAGLGWMLGGKIHRALDRRQPPS